MIGSFGRGALGFDEIQIGHILKGRAPPRRTTIGSTNATHTLCCVEEEIRLNTVQSQQLS